MKHRLLLLLATVGVLLAACGGKQPASSASLEAQSLDRKVFDALVAGQWETSRLLADGQKAIVVYRFRKNGQMEMTVLASGTAPAPIDDATTLTIGVKFRATFKGHWEYANRMATISYDRSSLALEVDNVGLLDKNIDRTTLSLLNEMLDDDAVRATLREPMTTKMLAEVPDGEVLSNIDVTVGAMTARDLNDNIITFQRR